MNKLFEIVHTKGSSLQALRQITNKLAESDEQKVSRNMLTNIAHQRLMAVQRNIALPLTGGEGVFLESGGLQLAGRQCQCAGLRGLSDWLSALGVWH